MKRTTAKPDKQIDYFQKYGLYILVALMLAIVLIAFYDFIVFDKLYLFKGLASDSMVDTYPNYILISDYLRTEGLPMWSFSQGMGQGIFPFSFPDPFVTFLYALGRHNIAYGIAYMEILKIFIAGIVFYMFLKKISVTGLPAILGALLYSFSGFVIVGSCWNIFSTEALYLAMLLFAFEKYYQDKSWPLLPITTALIAILQPFDLWLFGVFMLLYIIVRLGENKTTLKESAKLLATLALLAGLGVGMSAFFFISQVKAMLNSPRVGGDASYFADLLAKSVFTTGDALHNITALMRMFSTEMLGASNTFKGWYNFMEAPLFYCGIINLLLLPQVFLFLDKRKKIMYGIWLGIFIIPVIFPFFRYAFWLFTGDYYRLLGFFVSVLFILFSARALYFILKDNKPNLPVLWASVIVLLALLYYPYQYLQTNNILNTELQGKVALYIIVYAILLSLLRFSNYKLLLQVLITLTIFFETVYMCSSNLDERMSLTGEEHEQRFGFRDYTVEAIAYLNSIDSGFYRISKDYWSGPVNHPSFNDAKIQRYKGTGSYHSFNQPNYVRFLAGMNLIDEKDEGQTRWLIGLRNEPMLHSHVSLKYFLSKNPNLLVHINYDSLILINGIRIYRNKHVLPLGFTYDKRIQSKVFNELPQNQKLNMLYKAAVVNDSLYGSRVQAFPELSFSDTSESYTDQEYISDIEALRRDTLAISTFSNNYIKGTITASDKKILFFSIPFSDGWSAKVDGKEQVPIRMNIGFIGLILDKGTHTVELSYRPPSFKISIPVSLASISIYLGLLLYFNRHRFKKLPATKVRAD